MTDAVGKEILIEGADPRELYGPRNVYLDQMKSLHPQLRIVARGSSLKVLGSEAETRRFEERMEGLVAYYLKYGHISPQVIDQCFAGGIAATAGVVAPSLIIITLIAMLLQNFMDIVWVQHAFAGVRVAVCALIVQSVFKMAAKSVKRPLQIALALVSFVLVALLGASPVYIVVGCVLLSLALGHWGVKV